MFPIWWCLPGQSLLQNRKNPVTPRTRVQKPVSLTVLWGPRWLCEQVSNFRLSFLSVRTCGVQDTTDKLQLLPSPPAQRAHCQITTAVHAGVLSVGSPRTWGCLRPQGWQTLQFLRSCADLERRDQVQSWTIIVVWSLSIPQATAGRGRPSVGLALAMSRLPT